MKKNSVLALMTLLILSLCNSSCKKDDKITGPADQSTELDGRGKKCHITPPPPSVTPPTNTCGTATVVALLNAQQTNVGTVTIVNDATNLYVTYATSGNRSLREIHLFAGDSALVPLSQGNPNPQQFSHSVIFSTGQQQYTFLIPLSGLSPCFRVVAEAKVSQGYGCSEEAWGAGTRFPCNTSCNGGSNNYTGGGYHIGESHYHNGGYDHQGGTSNCTLATYFTVCKQTCNTSVCLAPPYQLFTGEIVWLSGNSVVVGGYTYNLAGTQSVLGAPLSDSRTALLLIATLKIYGTAISPPASVLSAANTVETWLSTLGLLGSTSQFTAPANVQTAIATLQTWETSQACQ